MIVKYAMCTDAMRSDTVEQEWNSSVRRQRSQELYKRAVQHIVGGVNSPSRAFGAVGGEYPVFMRRAEGARFWDVDGNRYLDYLGAYGALILGHAHPYVTEAIQKAAANGTIYGTPHELEITFVEQLKDAIPSLEKVRIVNTGTEAVMSAIRLARGATGRDKIVKFSGHYHGHSDAMLLEAGSGPSTIGVSDSAGVPDGVAKDIITVPYNDVETVTKVMEQIGDEVAALLLEPIVGNFGIVEPVAGFLEQVHKLAKHYGALVIYDEVITAFRFHYGAAQTLLGFQPDITVMGKIIGGGLPIGAYGGPADIMDHLAPVGTVYQSGTFAGNPLSLAAGRACLQVLQEVGVYEQLDEHGTTLAQGVRESAQRHGIPAYVAQKTGALSVQFTTEQVTDVAAADRSDAKLFGRFFLKMLDAGINLAPSLYEAWFITTAHTDNDIEYTLNAVDKVFGELAAEGLEAAAG